MKAAVLGSEPRFLCMGADAHLRIQNLTGCRRSKRTPIGKVQHFLRNIQRRLQVFYAIVYDMIVHLIISSQEHTHLWRETTQLYPLK
ncbi:hypothetical protein FKM82_003381 [Ascaphus truei]